MPAEAQRGALPGAARIDDAHGGAARRELVGDGQPHDARADDRDVHGIILVGSWQRAVGSPAAWAEAGTSMRCHRAEVRLAEAAGCPLPS